MQLYPETGWTPIDSDPISTVRFSNSLKSLEKSEFWGCCGAKGPINREKPNQFNLL